MDNLDSFTGSLAQLFLTLGAHVTVVRHHLPADAAGFDLLVLSPGPGRPEEHPLTLAALRGLNLPTFGVCLGMQAIALHFGGEVIPARAIVHGRTSRVFHHSTSLFSGLPSPFRATRYHSLAVGGLPECLEVLARTDDGEVMALRHRSLPISGVQFHPESVRSEQGLPLIANLLATLNGRA